MPYKNNFAQYENVASTLVLGDEALMSNPLLTIWIPTFQRDTFLRAAIDSVLALRNPQQIPIEIIVGDNDGAKGEASLAYQVVKSYNNPQILLYQHAENTGLFGNWNRCIELSRGKWCAMLHDDDLLLPNFLEVVGQYLQDENAPDIIGNTHSTFKESPDSIIVPENATPVLASITAKTFRRKYRPIGIAGLIVKKSMMATLGGYDEDYYPSSDWEIYLRALSQGFKIGRITQVPISAYRVVLNTSAKPDTRLHFPVANYRILRDYQLYYFDPLRSWWIEKQRKFRIFIMLFRLKNEVSQVRIDEAKSLLTVGDYMIGYLSPKTWFSALKKVLKRKK